MILSNSAAKRRLQGAVWRHRLAPESNQTQHSQFSPCKGRHANRYATELLKHGSCCPVQLSNPRPHSLTLIVVTVSWPSAEVWTWHTPRCWTSFSAVFPPWKINCEHFLPVQQTALRAEWLRAGVQTNNPQSPWSPLRSISYHNSGSPTANHYCPLEMRLTHSRAHTLSPVVQGGWCVTAADR